MSEDVRELDENLISSVQYLQKRWVGKLPNSMVQCGSGWAEVTENLTIVDEIPYNEIDCLTQTTVEGHESKLLLAKTATSHAMIFQGRRHWYEGVTWKEITHNIFLSKEMGCKNAIITNAAGGISEKLNVGNLMIIEDHINLMGGNPLIGPLKHKDIPRFVDQTEIYCRKLQTTALEISQKNRFEIKKGVYLGLTGPAFETPAEIRMLRTIGADAVGMSTIPEAMMANAFGMKIIAISCISNMAAGISPNPLSHEEVSVNTSQSMPTMKLLISGLLDSF